MSAIIDRRQSPKDKSLGSRQKFIRRAKEQIKKAVSDSVAQSDIKNFGKGRVNVPIKGIGEPTFQHDPDTGRRKMVAPGNRDFIEGDRLLKPLGGGRGGQASNEGDGEDAFEFALTHEEFIQFFFDDLELPDMVAKQMKELLKTIPKRAGYTCAGNPATLAVAATVKRAIGRRIALKRPKQEEIDALRVELETLEGIARVAKMADIELLEKRMRGIPYIDKLDLRYRNTVQTPQPNAAAVMICLMDVSGSMGEREKDIAKRFYILLYLLLHKKYEKVEIVFVRHHHEAEECSEHDFFHKRASGGTVVSEGLRVVNEVADRYPPEQWNIYVSQASDGDNWSDDAALCGKELERLLPRLQYFTYLDIPSQYAMEGSPSSALWVMYSVIKDAHANVAMGQASMPADIWGVFQEFFKPTREAV